MMRSSQLNALTSLRFFAAACIVLHHLLFYFSASNTAWIERLALHQGVAFFFVLSGFILTYVHPRLTGSKPKMRFMLARFGRIYPMHLIGLVAALLTTRGAFYQKYFAQILGANLLLVQDWIPKQEFFFSLNSPAWSISCEFFFYLCFLFLIQKISKHWPAILLGSFTLTVGCLIADATVFSLPSLAISNDVHRWLTLLSPLLRLFEFCLGMCTANFFIETKQSGKVPAFVHSWSELVLVLICFALLFLPFAFSMVPENKIDWRIAEYACTSGGAPIYAMLIFVFAFQAGKLSKFLAHSFFVLLGKVSFALYLLHAPVLFYLMNHKSHLSHYNQGWLFLDVWLFLLFISYLSYTFIETPLRKLINRETGLSRIGHRGESSLDVPIQSSL